MFAKYFLIIKQFTLSYLKLINILEKFLISFEIAVVIVGTQLIDM